jgi:hypothetical protein
VDFPDYPHNLEIDSFKIAVSEHIFPRPLIDGFMFIMACDDVFILKCD